jgi:branched-chain amino acid transport system permease protein
VGVFEGNSMLASFGLMFIIQNLALVIWGPEIRGYTYLAQPVDFGGAVFGANRLLTLSFAVVIGVVFYLYLARTRMGKAIRAAAQDRSAAALMGININYVLAVCFALGAAMAGVAGMLISIIYPVNGLMGFEYTTIAIIVVVLGGLGSIPGSFIGGFLLGLVGSVVTYFQPGLALAAYYAIFILLLLARPTGIMGK